MARATGRKDPRPFYHDPSKRVPFQGHHGESRFKTVNTLFKLFFFSISMGYFIGEIINFPPPSLKNKKIKKKVFNFFYKYAFSRLLAQSKCMCINAFTLHIQLDQKVWLSTNLLNPWQTTQDGDGHIKPAQQLWAKIKAIILKLETRRTT